MNVMELAYKILHYTCRRVYICIFVNFEMLAGETIGRKFSGQFPSRSFPKTQSTCCNQVCINGFLVAGLILVAFNFLNPRMGQKISPYFFLGCVLVAGVYGAFTASMKSFWVQGFAAIDWDYIILLTYFFW